MNFLAVFIGGGLGSLARYSLGLGISKLGWLSPWSTLASNVLATALLLTLMVQASAGAAGWPAKSQPLFLLLTVGFCGAFSTFSTFAADTLTLHASHGLVWSVTNVLANVLLCLAVGALVWTNSPAN